MLHLLPDYHKEKVISEYRGRVLTVFSIGLLILIMVSAIFLIPVYISTHGRYALVDQQKQDLEIQIQRSENTNDAEKVKEIVSAVGVLKQYALKEAPSDIFNRILVNKPKGILVTGFIYTPPSDIKSTDVSTVDISGVASNRIVLAAFNDALKKDKVFKSVFIPISSFAKEKDIQFTVKLTISRESTDWTSLGSEALTSTSTTQ